MARTSPVFGFWTITTPPAACHFLTASSSAFSAMYWMFSSRVRTTFLPGCLLPSLERNDW